MEGVSVLAPSSGQQQWTVTNPKVAAGRNIPAAQDGRKPPKPVGTAWAERARSWHSRAEGDVGESPITRSGPSEGTRRRGRWQPHERSSDRSQLGVQPPTRRTHSACRIGREPDDQTRLRQGGEVQESRQTDPERSSAPASEVPRGPGPCTQCRNPGRGGPQRRPTSCNRQGVSATSESLFSRDTPTLGGRGASPIWAPRDTLKGSQP